MRSFEQLLIAIPRKKLLRVRKAMRIFNQGDPADAVYCVTSGAIKISASSANGQDAVLMLLRERTFFGEGCLAGLGLRKTSATALEPSSLLRIEKEAILRTFAAEPLLARDFIEALALRNENLHEHLSDSLLHPSEKRLARTLLKLARSENDGVDSEIRVKRVSHQTLAEMVGTTRPHVTEFMAKFKRMNLIAYKSGLLIRTGLLARFVGPD